MGIGFVALNEIGWSSVGACQGNCLGKSHSLSPVGGPAGFGGSELVKTFSSGALLARGRGCGLETGSVTARLALELRKFLKIKVT